MRRLRLAYLPLVALAIGAACEHSTPLGTGALLTAGDLDGVALSYVCGNRFRVRSASTSPLELTYVVLHTDDEGAVYVPARPEGAAYVDVVFETAATGTVRLFDGYERLGSAENGGTACPPDVPVVAPDTVPISLFEESNIVEWSGDGAGLYVREMVLVLFARGTPATQREAAIGSIRGTVVGGRRSFGSDGFYWVRVPVGSDMTALFDAVDTLAARTGVEIAAPARLRTSQAAYRLPDDGSADGHADWLPSAWRLRTNESDGENRALEQINAPLAWGCSVGGPSVKVAVIDQYLWPIPDLENAEVVVPAAEDPAKSPEGAVIDVNHGSRVASIVGATGNNGKGMTGVLWSSSLRLYDLFRYQSEAVPLIQQLDYKGIPVTTDDALTELFYLAGLQGNDIVNLSLATKWDDDVPPTGEGTKEQRRARDDDRKMLRSALKWLADDGLRPLFVVAAGNYRDGGDVRWNGYANVRLDRPEQVLVVGGTAIDGTAWQNSAAGDLVDVVAPAVGVVGLRRDGLALVPGTGTSFATPLVTGVAGLLRDFDPSIPVVGLKDLIVEGSERGGRFAGGKPVLDAYEVLRHAAGRIGAPLCGNRIWAANQQVWAERDGGASESLLPVPIDPIYTTGGYNINALHGGKALAVQSRVNDLYEYAGAGPWKLASTERYAEVMFADTTHFGGTYLSSGGSSHSRSHQVTASRVGGEIRVTLRDVAAGTSRLLTSLPYAVEPKSVTVCSATSDGRCVSEGPLDVSDLLRYTVAFSAFGDSVHVGVTRFVSSGVEKIVLVADSVDEQGHLIQTFWNRPLYAVGRTDVVPVDTISGNAGAGAVLSAQALHWFGFSEDGRQVVMLESEYGTNAMTACTLRWRDPRTMTVLKAVPTTIGICEQTRTRQATVSPSVGTGGRGTSP